MQEQGSSRTRDWTARIRGTEGPIYLAIADAIGAAVAAGELQPGERLPTHRALADSLNVDLTTITRAYAEARKRGLLQATVGRGTFVRSQGMVPPPEMETDKGPADLSMNLPPLPTKPRLVDQIQQGLSRLLTSADATELLSYRSGCGTLEERVAGSAWLRPSLGDVEAERILICPGAQSALLVALNSLSQRDDVVVTDALTYPGIRVAAAQLGIRLIGVQADADGLLPEEVEKACREHEPKALYCVPTIHNPTTVTMSLERRRLVAKVAQRCALPILEDDAYGLLPSATIPAIASLAPDITLHIATVSKILSPALRVAYLVAPGGRWAARLCSALRASILMTSPLLTGLVTAWVQDGTASAVLSAIRRECAARQKIAREILPTDCFCAHPEGLHLWLRLPSRWDRRDFVAYLQRQDSLAVVPSDAFAVGSTGEPFNAVRVSLGAAASRDGLRIALRAVAAALQEEPAAAFANVV